MINFKASSIAFSTITVVGENNLPFRYKVTLSFWIDKDKK